MVCLDTPTKLVLNELIPLAATPAASVATPTSGLAPPRRPIPDMLAATVTEDAWSAFNSGVANTAELWEWVQTEQEEKPNSECSLPEKEQGHQPLCCMGWKSRRSCAGFFEFGEEERLVRAIDEKLDKLSFDTESVVSEIPWQKEVLQVHPKISLRAN